ncbi:MAG: hypothetical protein U5N85_21380 [Arcicella sp.]|nr:hypothetical protein [Arcicella sp.]
MKTLIFILLSVSISYAQILPKKLLIYYGIPSGINGATTTSQAASHFSQYDYVVWGNLIDIASHQNYLQSKQVFDLIKSNNNSIKMFGYLYIGLGNPTLTEVPDANLLSRIQSIKNYGFDGVLFDLCGTSDGCTAQRLRTAVNFAHSIGLSVIGNTGDPIEILHPSKETPQQNSPFLPTDFYLYESFLVMLNNYHTLSEFDYWFQTKSPNIYLNRLNGSRQEIQILSTTTVGVDNTTYNENKFFFSWFGAALNNHIATGWGELYFGANNVSPFRNRPQLTNVGTNFTAPIARSLDKFYNYRKTNLGQLWINTSTKKYGFALLNKTTSLEGGNWFDNTIWDTYQVPSFINDVIIRKHFQPVFIPANSNTAVCKSILIESQSIFMINSNAKLDCK